MTTQDGLAFEQGVQIFFIQKILAEEYGRLELVGDGDIGDRFFAEWSNIVRKHYGEESFSCTVHKTTIYRLMPENKKEELGVTPIHNEEGADSITDPTSADPTSQFYSSILEDSGYSDLLILLSDEELGQLMRIEYSTTIAGVSKQQDSDLLSTEGDVIIKNAIAQELKKESLDLTEKDYGFVTKLNLTGKKFSDITLLTRCKNLRQLNLSGTGISNISAVKGLTNLITLSLNNNQINDISPLSQLTNMKVLYLSNNKISNISTLNNMTNLTELWLSNNQISDISSLSHLRNLTTLSLYENQISDISHIAGLANLTKLDLRINQIGDISALSELESLKQLQLSKNQIVDIEPLKNLTNLILLDLNNTEVNDLTPIRGLDKLELLYASSR